MKESTAHFDEFVQLVSKAAATIGDRPLDRALEAMLTQELPPGGRYFQEMRSVCQAGVAAGWMCSRSAAGIRYGRVVKPAGPLGRFSVDVVEMTDVAGPAHAHPTGEVDMIMPLDPTATFDGCGAGWLVYPPASRHAPTVARGKALILYLLPDGAIDFHPESARVY